MSKITRRQWLFQQQNGRCYLMTTNGCRARDGRMRLDPPLAGDWASWEHVIPRAKKPAGAAALKLLACRDCNVAKGHKLPSPEHLDLALNLSREWFRLNYRQRPKWRRGPQRRQSRRRLGALACSLVSARIMRVNDAKQIVRASALAGGVGALFARELQ